MSTYRPLPKSLTISESPIDGLGLFAVEDIPKGVDLGIARHKIAPGYSYEGWLRTPLGGFINHSDEPNCLIISEYVDKPISDNLMLEVEQGILLTLKDIKTGEELTLKYTLYKV